MKAIYWSSYILYFRFIQEFLNKQIYPRLQIAINHPLYSSQSRLLRISIPLIWRVVREKLKNEQKQVQNVEVQLYRSDDVIAVAQSIHDQLRVYDDESTKKDSAKSSIQGIHIEAKETSNNSRKQQSH